MYFSLIKADSIDLAAMVDSRVEREQNKDGHARPNSSYELRAGVECRAASRATAVLGYLGNLPFPAPLPTSLPLVNSSVTTFIRQHWV